MTYAWFALAVVAALFLGSIAGGLVNLIKAVNTLAGVVALAVETEKLRKQHAKTYEKGVH
jgi:hypothetical protein